MIDYLKELQLFVLLKFQIKLVSRLPSSSVSERNKVRVLLPLTFLHNDDKACAPVCFVSPVVSCSRCHYKVILRIIDKDWSIQHHPGLAQQNCEPCVTVSGDPSDPLVGIYR